MVSLKLRVSVILHLCFCVVGNLPIGFGRVQYHAAGVFLCHLPAISPALCRLCQNKYGSLRQNLYGFLGHLHLPLWRLNCALSHADYRGGHFGCCGAVQAVKPRCKGAVAVCVKVFYDFNHGAKVTHKLPYGKVCSLASRFCCLVFYLPA